ncbi:hypothetical protein OG205_13520 [Lentzea sp. NBC_00516]|uniref:hypothetical protein n=1 Tax=Lentzea sp. NBC_00516 TaxID=2903582 RepID=UPI002E816029|nr:hypothetical protein [Lentzea sp. NBC_00516]WUD27970.1 hypothetical protein OG205_13520 [Lentzea sp. NBC_00516]
MSVASGNVILWRLLRRSIKVVLQLLATASEGGCGVGQPKGVGSGDLEASRTRRDHHTDTAAARSDQEAWLARLSLDNIRFVVGFRVDQPVQRHVSHSLRGDSVSGFHHLLSSDWPDVSTARSRHIGTF